MRCCLSFSIGCLLGLLPGLLPADEKPGDRPVLVNEFPADEEHGGWGSLLPEKGDPDPAGKARIRDVAGVDWDKLQLAWQFLSK